MNVRLRFLTPAVALAAAAVALAAPPAKLGSRPAVAAGPTATPDGILARGKISHVVVIVMENRTFDNVFGGDSIAGHPTPYPNAAAAIPAPIATLMRTATFVDTSGSNNFHNVFQCVASGGFTNAQWQQNAQSPMPCSGWKFASPNQPFWYLAAADRTVYSAIAQQYELGDAFFAPASSDSFPAHQYIVAGQSSDADGDTIADQPYYLPPHGGYTTGCADATATSAPTPAIQVPALGSPASPWAVPTTRGLEGECYAVTSFADRLAASASSQRSSGVVDWQHFATQTAIPAAYSGEQPFNGFVNIKRWWNHRWAPSGNNVLALAQRGGMPGFAWVKPPCVDASDHPGTGEGGPSWVQDVVNAVGSNTTQWERTAIFVVWDDWGGLYDHVVPPSPRAWDHAGPGLRTPFLIVSPYVKPNTVAHGTADYGSVMRFVEELYSIPPLGNLDTHSPELSGFFDFSTARPFVKITAAPSTPWAAACKNSSVLLRD
jgi:phospholipase C